MDMLWGVLDVGFLPRGWGRDGLIGERGYFNAAARGGGCTLCLVRKEISLVVKFTVIWAGIGEGRSFPLSGKEDLEGRGYDFPQEMLSIRTSPYKRLDAA